MSRPKRILVTGSRDWSDVEAIDNALYRAWKDLGGAAEEVILVSGACPTGADAIAEKQWGSGVGVSSIERHPADWKLGRSAGPARNRKMVRLGADICLAFIGPCTSPRCNIDGQHDSHGTTGCADLAEGAGIEVRRFRA